VSAKPYLITCLPQSAEAWLSVLCTTEQSLCYHDQLPFLSSLEDLRGLYDSTYYKNVGIADSGLGFFLPWIMDNIKPRTVIIDRDPQEVTDALVDMGLMRTNHAFVLYERLKEFFEHPLVMRVPYEALGTKRVMQKIFWHLMPGATFDESRYDQLSKMYIQAMPQIVVANDKRQGKLMRDILPLIKELPTPAMLLEGHNYGAGKLH
jgi:hypothetical protein